MDWNEYFFSMLEPIAQKSKDTNTKIGCIIVAKDNSVRAIGFNGFPRKVNDQIQQHPERFQRPEKYAWTVHAEANAVCAAAKVGVPLEGCRIYLNWLPCCACAGLIIQAGIGEVYISHHNAEDIIQFPQFRFDVSLQMFREAEVKVFV